jgi:hypothetical protein
MSADFVIARNAEPGSTLPYLLRVPLGDGRAAHTCRRTSLGVRPRHRRVRPRPGSRRQSWTSTAKPVVGGETWDCGRLRPWALADTRARNGLALMCKHPQRRTDAGRC